MDSLEELLEDGASKLLFSLKILPYINNSNWIGPLVVDPPIGKSDMEPIAAKLKEKIGTKKVSGWYIFETYSSGSLMYIGSSGDLRYRLQRHIEKMFVNREEQQWRIDFWRQHPQRWNVYWCQAWQGATEEEIRSIEYLLQVALRPCYENYKRNRSCICIESIDTMES